MLSEFKTSRNKVGRLCLAVAYATALLFHGCEPCYADKISLEWKFLDPSQIVSSTVYWGTNSDTYYAWTNVHAYSVTMTNFVRDQRYFFRVSGTDQIGRETELSYEIVTWATATTNLVTADLSQTGTNFFTIERTTNFLSWQTFVDWQPITNSQAGFRLRFRRE